MKPQTLQNPRQVITTILTVIGLGLFVLVALKGAHEVANRQYTEGKPRIVPQTATVLLASAQTPLNGSASVLKTGLQPVGLSNPGTSTTTSSSSSTPQPGKTSASNAAKNQKPVNNHDNPNAQNALSN